MQHCSSSRWIEEWARRCLSCKLQRAGAQCRESWCQPDNKPCHEPWRRTAGGAITWVMTPVLEKMMPLIMTSWRQSGNEHWTMQRIKMSPVDRTMLRIREPSGAETTISSRERTMLWVKMPPGELTTWIATPSEEWTIITVTSSAERAMPWINSLWGNWTKSQVMTSTE